MATLTLSAETKRKLLEYLEAIPRPHYLAGKVRVQFEFNCTPTGEVKDVYADVSVREQMR